ncbi:hypothetical protein TSPI_05489 [Trichinella spiralis]|uniref:Uncharacterized protein n=1 Tax=Trichinella spiralis TaxID=6334 RepID=A0ABR3K9J9_TRISP
MRIISISSSWSKLLTDRPPAVDGKRSTSLHVNIQSTKWRKRPRTDSPQAWRLTMHTTYAPPQTRDKP